MCEEDPGDVIVRLDDGNPIFEIDLHRHPARPCGDSVASAGEIGVTKPLLREFGPRSFALEPLAGLPS